MNKLFRKLFPSKELREYRKMYRRHRKELVKLAKETHEFDWCWLHQSVIMQIRHMHEYYSAGNNVWQSEEERLLVIEKLKHVLDLDAEIDKAEDDDFGIKTIYDGDKIVDRIRPDDLSERIYANEIKIAELYEELYRSIGRDIRYWWD